MILGADILPGHRLGCRFYGTQRHAMIHGIRMARTLPEKRVNTHKCRQMSIHDIRGFETMDNGRTPTCDKNHDETPMRRVWADGHGDVVYQCPLCGRKMQVRE